MREIKKLVVHCSDTQDSLDIKAKDIKKWHTDLPPMGNGWSDIGYHYVIRRDGTIERGRQDKTPGAHVRGHNKETIGICWVGRKSISDAQLQSLYSLLQGLMNTYGLDVTDIYGHTELDSGKTCPNLDMNFIRLHTLFHTGIINHDEI